MTWPGGSLSRLNVSALLSAVEDSPSEKCPLCPIRVSEVFTVVWLMQGLMSFSDVMMCYLLTVVPLSTLWHSLLPFFLYCLRCQDSLHIVAPHKDKWNILIMSLPGIPVYAHIFAFLLTTHPTRWPCPPGHWCYSASFRRCDVCCGHYFISQNAFFCFLLFCLNISIGCNCCSDGEEVWCGNPSGSLTKFPGVTSRTPSSFHLNIFSKEKTCHNFIQDRFKASSWSSLVCSCSLKVLQLHLCGFDAWFGPLVA